MKQNNYKKFFLMISSASVFMYATMYLNTYATDHIYYSETRLYMTLLMASVMTVVMLIFMSGMYTNKKMNAGIYISSIAVFVVALFLVRTQVWVDDVDFMEGMIPHHSIAILTSERAQITDPRVRELADEIIEAQKKEIREMKLLIADLKEQDN